MDERSYDNEECVAKVEVSVGDEAKRTRPEFRRGDATSENNGSAAGRFKIEREDPPKAAFVGDARVFKTEVVAIA